MGQQVAGVAKMMGKWSSGRFVGMEEASAWLICYSMIFYVFEVKYFVYCVFAFCFSESGIFYSMPFS